MSPQGPPSPLSRSYHQLVVAVTGLYHERDLTLEERANPWIVRERRRPELDHDEALRQVDAVDQGPDRRWLTVLLFEAITSRRGDKAEVTVRGCMCRKRYRSFPLVKHTLRMRVGAHSLQEIVVSLLPRGRGLSRLAVFGDHDQPPLDVYGLDRVKRQQAPMPEKDPVSTNRKSLPARLRIVD